MKQVICRLPNASTEIGGVKFAPHNGVMISAPMDDVQAERFGRIPGYEIVNVRESDNADGPPVDERGGARPHAKKAKQ